MISGVVVLPAFWKSVDNDMLALELWKIRYPRCDQAHCSLPLDVFIRVGRISVMEKELSSYGTILMLVVSAEFFWTGHLVVFGTCSSTVFVCSIMTLFGGGDMLEWGIEHGYMDKLSGVSTLG